MKNNYQTILMLAIAVIAMALPINLKAQNEGTITFQGVLYEAGEPVTATKQIVFSITAVSWTETHSVSVVNGLYSVVLGEDTPFPKELFAATNKALLGISVAGTALPPVEIHAPFVNKAIVARNMPDQIDGVFNEDADEHSTLAITASGTGKGQNSALEAVSETTDRNTGIEGFAISGDGNAERQTGLYGQSQGSGSGDHRGVVGVALGGSGKYNKGIYGYSSGTGNGDTGQGFGEGSINFGVEGKAEGNSYNNTGVEGANFGEAGQWNFGVHGISNAGTGTGVENHGVAGRAYGPGINYGVYGTAGDGEQNWAGWFEGDVKVNGNLELDGSFDVQELSASTMTVSNETGEVKGEFSVYGPTNAGSVVLYGNNNERNVILGSSSGGNRGFLGLYDPEGNSSVGLHTGEDGTGNILTYGNNHYRTGQFGGFSGNGFWKISDPNEDGSDTDFAITAGFWAGEPEFIMERAQGEQGVKMRINADPDGDDPDGWNGKMTLYGDNSLNVQLGGKQWENNNLPFLNFQGTSDESMVWMDVSQDTNTMEEWGNFNVNSSNGANVNINGGGIDLNGPNGEQFRLDYNGLGGNNTSFPSLQVHNEAVDANVADIGRHGPNGNYGYLRVRGANEKEYVNLDASYNSDKDIAFGYFALQGENSPNFRIGAQDWRENGEDLPYLAMNGGYTRNDGEGDYHPDMIWMEVSQDTNTGAEWGHIRIDHNDGSHTSIDAGGIGLNGPNGEHLGIDYNGIHGDINSSSLGSEAVTVSEKDWEPGIQGFVHLYGETPDGKDNIRVSLEVSGENENNSSGHLSLHGPVFNDSNCGNCPRGFVNASVHFADEHSGDPDKWFGQLDIMGHNSSNIQLGAKTWEENGTDLPVLQMWGVDDQESKVGLHVTQDTNTQTEWGELNLSNNDGSHTNISANGLSFHGPGGEYFSLDYNGLGNNTRFPNLQIHNGNDDGEVVHMGAHGPDGSLGYVNLRGSDNGNDLAGLNIEHNPDHDTEWGVLFLQGANSNNFNLRAKDWEPSGADFPQLTMAGTSDDKIWLEVSQDTNTGHEWGALNLNDNSGNNAGIDGTGSVYTSQNLRVGDYFGGSGAWLDQDGSLELRGPSGEQFRLDYDGLNDIRTNSLAIKQQSDHNNNSFEVYDQNNAGYMNINDSNNGNSISMNGDQGSIDAARVHLRESVNVGGDSFDGELNISSMTNTGIRMYANLDDIGGSRSHIALDGNNGEYVNLWGDGGINASTYMSIGYSDEIYLDGSNGHISASSIDAPGPSDRRFKKNIKPIEGALAKSTKLNGKTYQWNDLAEKEKNLTENQNRIGVIAQEVEKLFPELVQTDKKGFKSVDYAGLTAVLLEAVKELSAKVTNLESENSDLKASLDKLSRLESKINLLEKLLINKPVEASTTTAQK